MKKMLFAKKMVSALVLTCLCLALALAGCGGAAASGAPAVASGGGAGSDAGANGGASGSAPASLPAGETHQPVTMLLAAAASLETTFTADLIPLFQDLYPWVTVEGTYDSSGKLQTQMEEGLAADVFMSAATKQMTALAEAGLVDEATVVKLLENEIVLIAPAGAAPDIAAFADIGKAATIALGDPESVPAGQYAKEALTSLGVYDAIADKVSFGTNVTEVLNWVAEGSADVGIVYATDAAQMPDKVQVLAIAPAGSLEKPVLYPVGIVSEAPQREAAELFVEFLQSPEAMQIFVDAGFKANV